MLLMVITGVYPVKTFSGYHKCDYVYFFNVTLQCLNVTTCSIMMMTVL